MMPVILYKKVYRYAAGRVWAITGQGLSKTEFWGAAPFVYSRMLVCLWIWVKSWSCRFSDLKIGNNHVNAELEIFLCMNF